jgi:alkylhydroperoxidase family enzyme
MARLDPPTAVDDTTRDLLALASAPDGTPLPTIAVLAHSPRLVGPFLGWAAALALEGALPARAHEIVALRAAFRCGSDFEWTEHTAYARQAGLTDDEIARVAGDAAAWEGPDAILLEAVDSLVADHRISDALWVSLRAAYGPAELVELCYVTGQYTMLSMVANGLGLNTPTPG